MEYNHLLIRMEYSNLLIRMEYAQSVPIKYEQNDWM